MTVRRLLTAVAALIALHLGAGCTQGDDAPLIAEVDEPFYVQGVQLRKQGRNPEALTSFLKVIEKRGDRAAPESHFEAGLIYLNHTKDPVMAYYHFRQYLELQPNSKQAPFVRGMVEAALREFARRIPGRPLDDQSLRTAADEELAKLRRENEELRAELATLRNGVAAHRLPRVIPLQDQPPVPGAALDLSPPATSATATARTPVTSPERTFFNPVRPPAVAPPASAPLGPTTRAARVHTVRARDSLWAIAREYYGSGVTGGQVRAIFEANRGVLRSENDLRPGMTLRIP